MNKIDCEYIWFTWTNGDDQSPLVNPINGWIISRTEIAWQIFIGFSTVL